MNAETYDIFICYRRENGVSSAKHLRDILHEKGYNVFFDTDSLRSGSFNHELIEVIKNCKDFILILSPNSLDRCSNKDDWVRQELACALKHGKNIIPVFTNQFVFPDELPDEINEIRWRNGIQVNYDYFDAVVNKLISFLQSKPHKQTHRWPILLATALCIIAIVASIFLITNNSNKSSTSKSNNSEPTTTQETQSTISVDNTTQSDETNEKASESAVTAFIGIKSTGIFHNPYCIHVRTRKKAAQEVFSTSEEAIKAGYTPCEECTVHFIGNTYSRKFHTLDCEAVKMMKESSRVEFFSREEAIEVGYVPCGDCNP